MPAHGGNLQGLQHELSYTANMVEEAIEVLERYLPGQRWEIAKPARGWRKECYIASCGAGKYFLKFDVPVAILERLGEIRVAPRVLYSGVRNGLRFVVQEFVEGTHPEGQEWMRRHLDELVTIIKSYHEDQQLFALLAETHPVDFRLQMRRDLEWLSERFSRCDLRGARTIEIETAFRGLLEAATSLDAEPLTPVHNDPSPTNILFSGGRLVFLDWDEVTLSDPMRDIGLLLWWNFPPEQWHLFFEKYGVELSAARQAKIYRFAARASLDVALWHAEHNLDGQGFIDDFLAASTQQPNPKGYSALWR